MESIEQPFDSLGHIGQDPAPDSSDKADLMNNDVTSRQAYDYKETPRAENSPLHQDKARNSILHGPQNSGLRIIIVSSVVFALAVTVALILTIYLEPNQVHGHAAVTCDDARCSEIGLKMLKQSGNAVDAAVAVAFCLGVVNPAHSGIGGGGFAVVHDHKFQESWGYDFQEVAPAALTTQTDVHTDDTSAATVGVPGFVKGLRAMHDKHGKLAWEDVLQPSIDLAGSFHVSEELAMVLSNQNIAEFLRDSQLASLFLQPSRTSFKTVNDTVRWPALVSTLVKIRNDADSLYSGQLLEDFMEDLIQLPGNLMDATDMRNYSVSTPEVITTKFQELSVIGLPPPAGGTLVAIILNMVGQLGWKEKQKNSSAIFHELIETFKFSFAHRGLLGDPTFNPGMKEVKDYLLSEEFTKHLVSLLDKNQTNPDPSHYGPYLPSKSAGSSHISVIDSSELIVSATMSLNTAFGTRTMLQNTGILLNNKLMDFSHNKTSANGQGPGKRPQSNSSPTLLVNKDHPCNHRLIIGAAGGSKIITGIAQSVINSVIFHMNISSAISAPRVHDELTQITLFEAGIPTAVQNDLKAMGHNLRPWPITDDPNAVNGLEKTNDNIRAYADYRKLGGTAVF